MEPSATTLATTTWEDSTTTTSLKLGPVCLATLARTSPAGPVPLVPRELAPSQDPEPLERLDLPVSSPRRRPDTTVTATAVSTRVLASTARVSLAVSPTSATLVPLALTSTTVRKVPE